MRVIAGELGGRRLVAPKGGRTRPTADRVREALFSILGPVDGLDVLDLFAGSGALGIEALSRGAASATFVDRSPAAVAAIRTNVAMVGDPRRVRVLPIDWRVALRAEARAGRRFGLCLLDPPYSLLPRILGGLGTELRPVLAPVATVVVESAAGGPVELEDLDVVTRTDRTYGDTQIAVARVGEAP
ncbi:MAG TPA: RsmD family RNA methyltransferase [Miltoncostaeaceae bacterium]|nr:RsmD family RNA methyltransferase [Miltoncostaeaceae bacterium]